MALDGAQQDIGRKAFAQEHGYKLGSLEDLMRLLDSKDRFFVGVVYSPDGNSLEIDTISKRDDGDYLLLLHETLKRISYKNIMELVENSQRKGYEPQIYLH